MPPRKPRRHGLRLSAQIARERALEALNLMRGKGRSLRRAATEAHTSPKTVLKYAGRALARTEAKRYRAKPSDRLTRTLQFLTPKGKTAITVRGSRLASRIARYWAAVDKYLTTGDAAALAPFRGKSVTVGRQSHAFVTDRRVLERLGYAGEVSFEDLYAKVA